MPLGSSPHTRGALRRPQSSDRGRRIIPAYAGSTSRGRWKNSPIWGSSPHTRGALARVLGSAGLRRIIPAYAGSTRRASLRRITAGDHPRIRGEHSGSTTAPKPAPGSSPHTRGALVEERWSVMAVSDHPRIRGEHENTPPGDNMRVGSSPHTRGAHLGIPAIPRIAAVIIPVFLYPSPTPQEEADRSMVLLTLS